MKMGVIFHPHKVTARVKEDNIMAHASFLPGSRILCPGLWSPSDYFLNGHFYNYKTNKC